MKHIPTPYPDINMPFFAGPLAFSRPVRSLAADKALHRRSSRVWCCCGTCFFNCCDWEREHKASMVDMFAWRHQHPYYLSEMCCFMRFTFFLCFWWFFRSRRKRIFRQLRSSGVHALGNHHQPSKKILIKIVKKKNPHESYSTQLLFSHI